MRIRQGLYSHSPLVLVLVCSLQKNISLLGAKRLRCAEVLFHPKTYQLLVGYNTTVGAKRFRYAEELFLPVSFELPDGNIFTLAAKRFRCTEVLFQSSFQPAESTSLSSKTESSSLFVPNASIAQICCSSPKALRGARRNIMAVSVKRFRCLGVLFHPKGLRAAGRKHHHCWRLAPPSCKHRDGIGWLRRRGMHAIGQTSSLSSSSCSSTLVTV